MERRGEGEDLAGLPLVHNSLSLKTEMRKEGKKRGKSPKASAGRKGRRGGGAAVQHSHHPSFHRDEKRKERSKLLEGREREMVYNVVQHR